MGHGGSHICIVFEAQNKKFITTYPAYNVSFIHCVLNALGQQEKIFITSIMDKGIIYIFLIYWHQC